MTSWTTDSCQTQTFVDPKSYPYGDRSGKLLELVKVVKGRLTELKHTKDLHWYDWVDEADIPKGTKIETVDDIKPRDGDDTSVRSCVVVQQYNVIKREDVHQGTPPLKVLRLLLAVATSKGSHRQKVCGIWDVSVAFFHSPMDDFTVVRPPPGLRVRGKLCVSNRALNGTRMASRCFGKLVVEVMREASVRSSHHCPEHAPSTERH